jgi:protein arginine kinase activator
VLLVLCEKCKKKLATVYITKVINEQKYEQMLCFDCAKQENVFPLGLDGHVSVDSLLKGLFGGAQPSAPSQESRGVFCPVCGMTMEKLAERGRFGCDECYDVFGEAALRTIKRIHGRKHHVGKMPKRMGGALSVRRKLIEMRSKLEACVLREEYEEAASLRDAIKDMEKALAGLPEAPDGTK